MTLKDLDISKLKNQDITILHQPIRKKKKQDDKEFEYLYVGNIPSTYRTADLRFIFKDFVEAEAFKCFHYRHRPEKQVIMKGDVPNCESDTASSRKVSSRSNEVDLNPRNDDVSSSSSDKDSATCCCMINIDGLRANQFISRYNGKEWRKKDLTFCKRTVNIKRIKLKTKPDDETTFKTNRDIKTDKHTGDQELYIEDLKCSIELNPPEYIMPNGNVGTTTKYFHGLIKECKMPASLIKSLALEFPRSRKDKAYSNVPPNYVEEKKKEKYKDSSVSPVDFTVDQSCHEYKFSQRVQRGRPKSDIKQFDENASCSDYIPSKVTSHDISDKQSNSDKQSDNQPNSDQQAYNQSSCDESDDVPYQLEEEDGAEDWERHEALHDDVDNQSRPKERLFEEDIELKWEKGGSGLVFYTDAYYWNELKGKDFDADTVDDWDVDYSIYYEDGAGDKPARDQHDMRIEQRRREAKEDGPLKPSQLRRKEKRNRNQMNTNFAEFEKYSKGFGSRILKEQGWTEGSGVGSSREGLTEPLDQYGQEPHNRKGLGYYGEKLDHTVDLKKKVERDIHISTKYDEKDGEDRNALRFHGLDLLKHRGSDKR